MEQFFAAFGGTSVMGPKRKTNEDDIQMTFFDTHSLLALVADGSGTGNALVQPAKVINTKVFEVMRRVYESNRQVFNMDRELFFKEAIYGANNDLIAFKMANEEMYYGFACMLSGVFISDDLKMTLAHVGNTRIYLIREGKIIQLTKDQTAGQTMVDAGILSEKEYYVSQERLEITNALGQVSNDRLFIRTASINLKDGDVVVLTTDGIHYSIRPEAIRDTILSMAGSDPRDIVERVQGLAYQQGNYLDNESIMAIWV